MVGSEFQNLSNNRNKHMLCDLTKETLPAAREHQPCTMCGVFVLWEAHGQAGSQELPEIRQKVNTYKTVSPRFSYHV